jgi:hypothetical protein
MSEFELVDEFADEPPTTKGQWTLSRDEAATIWYALSAYKKQLVKEATTTTDTNTTIEDEAFLYQFASKCARLQFELRDDHHPLEEATRIRSWLDTE